MPHFIHILRIMPLVSPSLLSADFGNLQRDLEMLNHSECDWYHLDVMDGVFVPNNFIRFPRHASYGSACYQATRCTPYD